MKPDSQASPPPVRACIVATHFAEYSLRLATAFAAEGETLLICAKPNFSREVVSSMYDGAPERLHLRVFNNGRKFEALYFLLRTLVSVLLFRPTFIVAHEMGDWNHTAAIALLSRIFRVALVVHDPRPHLGADAAVRARAGKNIAIERRAAAALIVHGAYCARQLVEETALAHRALIVIGHGPILGDVGAPARAPHDILFFGRMQAYKGLGVLRQALEILDERGSTPKTILAGKGPALEDERSGLSRLTHVEIRERFLSPEEAGGLLRGARVVVVPYLEATQSGVVAAAFAAGRPVVASAVGSIPEVVEPGVNGLLVPAGDPAALAEALSSVLGDADLEARLAEGARATSRDISWAKVAGEIRTGVLA